MRIPATMLSLCALLVLTSCANIADLIADSTGDSGRREDTRDTRPAPTPGNRPGSGQDRGPSVPASATVPPPLFGDWWYTMPETMTRTRKPATGDPCAAVPRFTYDSPNTYVPVNHPGAGHGGPSYVGGGWYSWYARCYADKLAAAGAPVAVLIRNRNCPFPYNAKGHETSPGEVRAMLDAVPKLDYLIMDLETVGDGTPEDIRRNVAEIVRLVRNHPNPRVADAYIGNYQDWPGESDNSVIWPDRRDRTRKVPWNWDRDAFYREHFNLAMPSVYPYEVYSRHADAGIQKGPTAPNDRAAIFWAPLERLSAAARNLHEGHLLIPWVSNYVAYDKPSEAYNAPPPPREDLEAFIRHTRLRGAHSYMIWTSDADQTDHPSVSLDEYRRLAMRAWASLDPLLGSVEPGEATILNLGTDKESGVQWSGMIAGERIWVMVSNLGPRNGVTVRLPDLPGVPAETPAVPSGAHRLFRWRIDR